MYQNIFISRKENLAYIWDDKKGMISIPLNKGIYAYRKCSTGIYKSIYGDKLEKIYRFNPRDPSLFESDVKLETRFLVDLYEDSDEPSVGHKILYLDIEVSTDGGFPDVEKADKEITAIAVYDSSTEKYSAFILDKQRLIEHYDDSQKEVIPCQDEESLLIKFIDKWEQIQPTIVTGWNSDKFDMPYLYKRMKDVIGTRNAKRMSPIGTVYINDWNKKLIIAGVTHLDYMNLYKKLNIKQEASYALGAIGKKIVGMEKIAYRGSLNNLYKEDIHKYVEYNLNDVQIIVALEKKLQFIELARAICHKGHVPYEWYEFSSRFIEGAILMYLRRKGEVAKNKNYDDNDDVISDDDEEEGFEGAYVKTPVPGRYDWVFDLDLTSMYPNIIISLNLSPETKIGVVDKIDYDEKYKTERIDELKSDYDNLSDGARDDTTFEEYVEQRIYAYNARMYAQNKISNFYVGGNRYNFDEFKKLVVDSNLSIASNGVLCNLNKNGVIPEILIKWFDERKDLRKLAKKHADAKEWDRYEFYDQRQKVQKVLLNSIYGVLGLPSFRFYDRDNASAVTITGQDIIKTTGKAINDYYKKSLGTNNKDYIIYCDTDSVFVSALPVIQHKMPHINVDDEKQMTDAILAVTSEVQSYVNEFYHVMAKRFFNIDKHRFDAKQEVIAKTGFWLAKKRYAQFIINKGGIVCDELEIKGIDVVRTSFPIKFRKFMESFLQNMLRKVDKSSIDQSILKFKEGLKDLSIIDISKNTSVKFTSVKGKQYNPKNRQPFRMITGAPAQVKAALYYNDLLTMWNLNGDVPEIFHGQKIKWLYLKTNEYGIDCIALKADGTDPDKILEFIEKYADRTAMYEQELKGKLKDFYDVLNWNYPSENDAKIEEFFSF